MVFFFFKKNCFYYSLGLILGDTFNNISVLNNNTFLFNEGDRFGKLEAFNKIYK